MKTPDCVLDGEVCALDERRPAELLGDAAGKARHADRLRGLRPARGRGGAARRPAAARAARHGCEQLLDRRNATVRLSEAFEDGDALYEAARSSGSRGSSPSAPTRRTGRARRTREWLKIKTHGRQEFVIAGYTKGQGRRSGPLRLARARRTGAATSSTTPATSAPGSPTATIDELLAKLRPLETSRTAVSRASRRCRRCGRPTWSGSRPELVCRGRVRRVDARRPAARSVVPGAARGQDRRARCTARSRSRPSSAAASRVAQALEPRQGLLPGRRDHQGRPARLLPLGCAGLDAAPAATGRSR